MTGLLVAVDHNGVPMLLVLDRLIKEEPNTVFGAFSDSSAIAANRFKLRHDAVRRNGWNAFKTIAKHANPPLIRRKGRDESRKIVDLRD